MYIKDRLGQVWRNLLKQEHNVCSANPSESEIKEMAKGMAEM